MIYRLVMSSTTRKLDSGLLLAAVVLTTVVEGYRLGAIMVLCIMVLYGAAVGRLPLNRRWLVWLGAISYPWYLVHQNVGYALIRKLEAAGSNADIAIGLSALASAAIAYLLLIFIDRPAIKWLREQYIQKKQMFVDKYYKAV